MIVDGALVTGDSTIAEGSEVEIRPVISGGAVDDRPGLRAAALKLMKCRVCREPAVIEVRRHNAGFCQACFLTHCRNQVERVIKEHSMIAPGDRVLVAVSGGKDSLALWDILLRLGYSTDGLYIGLGIEGYSEDSGGYAERFAAERRRQARRRRPAPRLRLRRQDRGGRRPPGAVLCLRAVQAPHLRPGRARRGLRRRGDGPQPGRRGGRAARQRAPLGPRLHGPPAARPAWRRRLPPQGQAPGPPRRAGDGCLLRAFRASTTRSRNARCRSATASSATRTPSTPSKNAHPAPNRPFTAGSSSGVPNWSRTPTSMGAKASTLARNAAPRRRRARCARSAASSTGPRASSRRRLPVGTP